MLPKDEMELNERVWPIKNGGTGATTAEDALKALGVYDKFLALTGGTLSGDINGNYGVQYKSGNGHFIGWGDRTRIGINGMTLNITKNETSSINDALMLHDEENDNYYSIFGTHTKPCGSYIGNSDATERKIIIGGLNRNTPCLKINTTNNAFGFVFYNGAIMFHMAEGKVVFIPSTEVNFRNGILTLATASTYINYNAVTYHYQVL